MLRNKYTNHDESSSSSSEECSSSPSSSSESHESHESCESCDKLECYCKKMLYSIGAWADNRVIEIQFIPKNGNQINWIAPITLIPSNPTNVNHWNMQSPITQLSFPIFPLQINCEDKFVFKFNNDTSSPNAFACAANINGIIFRTANSTNTTYPNKINLEPSIGYNIVDPSYSPTTDLPTRNIIDTINYISVSPNNTNNYTLTWNL